MRLLLIALFTLMLCSVVSAQELSQYYKAGDEVNFTIPCFTSESASCPPTTACNLTIIDPTNDPHVSKAEMTQVGDVFVYNTSFSKLGDYEAYISCTDGTYFDSTIFYFQVNNQGEQLQDLLPYVIMGIVICGVFLFFMLAARETPFFWLFTVLLNLSLLLTFFLLYLNSLALSRIYYIIYYVNLLLFWPLLAITIYMTIVNALTFWKNKKKEKEQNWHLR